MKKKAIIKSTGVISGATGLSRILGFIRDIIIARLFGTGLFAQAFVVSFRIPNMFRDLVGEGATNAAFVPVLTEYRTLKSEEEYWQLARTLLNVMIVTLSVLVVAGIAASPVIVRLIAPGFIKEPEKLKVTITLTRALFPYLLLIGLSAYSMGVLNSLRHFTAPAFGPALLNVCVIASALFLCPRVGVIGLVFGVLAGGALQFGIQVPVLFKKGLRIERTFNLAHAAAKRIGRLLLPRMLGTAVYQINVFIDTVLASVYWIVGAGGVAALYYSNRLLQFPLAIFGLALAQVVLPTMSSQAVGNDTDKLKEALSFSPEGRLLYYDTGECRFHGDGQAYRGNPVPERGVQPLLDQHYLERPLLLLLRTLRVRGHKDPGELFLLSSGYEDAGEDSRPLLGREYGI